MVLLLWGWGAAQHGGLGQGSPVLCPPLAHLSLTRVGTDAPPAGKGVASCDLEMQQLRGAPPGEGGRAGCLAARPSCPGPPWCPALAVPLLRCLSQILRTVDPPQVSSRLALPVPDFTPALMSQHSSSAVAMAAARPSSPAGRTRAARGGGSCHSSSLGPWPGTPGRTAQGEVPVVSSPELLRGRVLSVPSCSVRLLTGPGDVAGQGLWASCSEAADLQVPAPGGSPHTPRQGRMEGRGWGCVWLSGRVRLSLVGTPDPGGRPGVCKVRGTLMMDRRRQVGSRQLARPSAARLVARCLP